MHNYLEKFSLRNKKAFITGGVGLIGTEISWAIASAGAKAVILDVCDDKGHKLEEDIKSAGFDAVYENFDITKLTDIEERIDALKGKFGDIGIWVNNAYPRTQDWGNSVEQLNLESWRNNIDMHLNSYAWISRKVALNMKESGVGGSIINFGSIYGMVGNDFTVYENTNLTSPMGYSAIKGGIISLTRYLASYFGKDGIRINNICPGGIFDNQNEFLVQNYEKKVPLKRMGKPEEIAAAVLFLASDAASYVTGATLMVDGGWTAI